MNPKAEALREAIRASTGEAMDHGACIVEATIRTIVDELGITEEAIRALRMVCDEWPYEHNVDLDMIAALSTLLELANHGE